MGELIDAPPLQVVVQLSDAARADAAAELTEAFVFTDDVRELFSRLLAALAQPHGVGVFLKGHYGSGKSHCLAYLRCLLDGSRRAAERLPGDLQWPERAWRSVSVPLFAFSADRSLESIVMEALQALPGVPLLADGARLLDGFRRYVYPQHAAQLPGYLQLPDDQALDTARRFLATLPFNPLALTYDRRAALAALGDQPTVVLLDELSEFLRSKPAHGAAQREDVRFLQFLGEHTAGAPLWVVATLQHSLEELGYGEDLSYLRIRERFALRFTLSTRHLGDLIGGRLIRHKPGSQPVLLKLWEELERFYPGLIEQGRFLQIYPVHPLTLELLESLMQLFSRQRGTVDFVHAQVAGDPLRGLPGLLGEPPDRLLTPDALFDHFRERFSEQAELAPYETAVWSFYERELAALYSGEREREAAAGVIKLLILAAISPFPVETRPERLALMLARRLSRLDPASNLQYLEERVLAPLLERGAYVVRRNGELRLDLQANANQLLGDRVRARLQGMKPDWRSALSLVNRPQLPLRELVGRPPQSTRVRWRQAQREGLWGWLEPPDLGGQLLAWAGMLEVGKEDWALAVLPPGVSLPEWNAPEADERGPVCLLVWQPTEPEPEMIEALLQWQAHRLVAEREPNLRAKVEPLLRPMEARLESWLFGLYARGELRTAGASSTPPAHETRPDRFLLACVREPLERRFPLFREVAPLHEALNAAALETLWTGLLAGGTAAFEPALDRLVEGLLVPLGLALREDERWRLALPATGPAPELLSRLEPDQSYDLHDLRRSWQKSPWGLVPGQFFLLLAALTQLGKLALSAHGRGFALHSMNDLLRHKVDGVGLASQRELPRLEQLEELAWLWGDAPLVPLSTSRVRELWRAARERLDQLHQSAERLEKLLSRVPAGFPVPVQVLGERLAQWKALSERLGTPHSSAQALHALVDLRLADWSSWSSEMEPWTAFLEAAGPLLSAQAGRLEALHDPELLDLWRGLEIASNPLESWTELRAQTEARESQQAGAYWQAHAAIYADPRFGERARLRASSEWRALESLGGVLGFTSQPSPARCRQRADELPVACRRAHSPLALECACGFRPGQPLPPWPDVAADLEAALRSGQASLREQAEPLWSYTRSLRTLHGEAAARDLEAALAWLLGEEPLGERACGELLALLHRDTVDHLSRALTGQALVVTRDLGQLLNALQDQRLPAAQVRARFEEWLQGADLRPGAWVHFPVPDAEPEAHSDPGGWLRLWIEQHALEAPGGWKGRYDLTLPARGEPPWERLGEELGRASAALDPIRAALQERLVSSLSLAFCQAALLQSLPRGWGDQLPEVPGWSHPAAVRSAARALEAREWQELARAWREWRRLDYEDPEGAVFPPALRSALEGELAARLDAAHPPVSVPLASAPAALGRELPPEGSWLILVVDGLRWDLWDLMRPAWIDLLGEPRRELLAEADTPTVTRRARELWLGGPEESPPGYDGLFLGRPLKLIKKADDKRQRMAIEGLLREPPPVAMLHFNFVDSRRHASELELWPLYRELLAEAEVRLLPWLRRCPAATSIMLLADHGFRDPGEGPAHGGGSWQERYVPAAVWPRGAV